MLMIGLEDMRPLWSEGFAAAMERGAELVGMVLGEEGVAAGARDVHREAGGTSANAQSARSARTPPSSAFPSNQPMQALFLRSPPPKTSFGPDRKKQLFRSTNDLQKLFPKSRL
ncbi:MAG: hypothetical protein ACKOTF_15700, partial [Opitutaceae bacterium]